VKTTIKISDNAVEFLIINSLALNIVRASFCSAAGSIPGRSSRDRRQTTVVSRGRLQDTGFRQASSKAVHGETSGKNCSSSVGLLLVFSRDRRQATFVVPPEKPGEARRNISSEPEPLGAGEARRSQEKLGAGAGATRSRRSSEKHLVGAGATWSRSHSEPEKPGEARTSTLLHQTALCSWRNNIKTATSVNCRWTSGSARTDVDHPPGYVISRWIAGWIIALR